MHRRSTSAARCGMTLLELMLVMALVGVLLGVGVGVLARLDLGRRAATGLVQNVIRSSRNSAVARGAPARVRFDPEGNTLRAEALAVVGTWHFEELSGSGAFDLGVQLEGARRADDGWIGRGLSIDGTRGEHALIAVAGNPSYDLSGGFAIELSLRLDEVQSGELLDLGGAAGLEVVGAQALRGWFVPEVAASVGGSRGGGRTQVQTPPGAVRVGTWARVRLEYDRRLLRLHVDGVELARFEVDAPVWRLEGPLVLGSRRTGTVCTLDALVIASIGAEEDVALPRTVRLAPDVLRELRFDASGHLDREVHAGPVSIALEHDDGTRRLVRVHLYGTVE